ncbi:hypothetical protein GCM10009844_07330 [Nocardioides koreensis]|uniref:Uncharacterized protein n=1 Tax=Nocardioides koreensis TaxID=433651 RepID=A0ABP5L259_9ACTN
MIDLQERFDQAWAGEPAPMDARQQLAVAHRGLRRRRMVVATGVLGVVAVLGGSLAAAGGVPGLDREPPAGSAYAAHSKPGEVEVKLAQTPQELEQISSDANAGYTSDGRVIVRPGWKVTQQIDDTWVSEGSDRSIALEIAKDTTGEKEWYYLEWGPDGRSVNQSWPRENPGLTLREWAPDKNGHRERP